MRVSIHRRMQCAAHGAYSRSSVGAVRPDRRAFSPSSEGNELRTAAEALAFAAGTVGLLYVHPGRGACVAPVAQPYE